MLKYHFTLQACETAQNFAWHFRPRISPSVKLSAKPPRTLLVRSAAERWMNIV